MDPTDRSIPPEIITKVMPSAMTAIIEACRRMLNRFAAEKNDPDRQAPAITRSNRPAQTPTECQEILANRLGLLWS